MMMMRRTQLTFFSSAWIFSCCFAASRCCLAYAASLSLAAFASAFFSLAKRLRISSIFAMSSISPVCTAYTAAPQHRHAVRELGITQYC